MTPRRYPLEPLLELLEKRGVPLTHNGLERSIGLSGSSLKGARRLGLLPKSADRYASKAGVHPAEIWPSWFEDAVEDHGKLCEWCRASFLPVRGKQHRFCSADCRIAAGRERTNALERERYRLNAEKRAKRLESERAYREEYRDYVIARQARYRAENREMLAAKKRAEYWADREKQLRKDARYRAANRERLAAKKREYDARKRAERRDEAA